MEIKPSRVVRDLLIRGREEMTALLWRLLRLWSLIASIYLGILQENDKRIADTPKLGRPRVEPEHIT
jgi:hypothetical protein